MSGNWVSIGSGNGLSPVRWQAITWTITDLLSIAPLGTHFSDIWIKIHQFSFIKMHLNMSAKLWPYCLEERWVNNNLNINMIKAKFMGPTWGPPGSCRPQMGPMLAPGTLLSGALHYCPFIRAIHQWPQWIQKVFSSHDLIMLLLLMSRSRLNNGATHVGWHFDIHRDFDTRGR